MNDLTLWPAEDVKRCIKCREVKPRTEFYRHSVYRGKVYLAPECKECVKKRTRAYALANPDRARASSRRHARKIAGVFITDEAVFDLWVSQGSVCAICCKPIEALAKTTHLDHDHATGKVRGVLCHRCNRAIGFFNESPELLERAADYIRAATKGVRPNLP